MYRERQSPEHPLVEHLRDNVYAMSRRRQGEIAIKCGVNRVYLCQFLSGLYEPKISFVIRLAKSLNVSVDYLLKDNGNRGCRSVVHKRIVAPVEIRKLRRKKQQRRTKRPQNEGEEFVD